ncbi:MAG TPA: hypothetical protein VFB33_14710 [Candidatus Binataceae bacterium]|jgi:hypothetical protein|nr:hypothetical protein [Candidatus Binataceae bacterium]
MRARYVICPSRNLIRRRRALELGAILVAVTLCISACQTYVQQRRAERQAERERVIQEDHGRILIYTGGIQRPYDKLGDLSYSDPLNGETIDTDYINEKLRQMAIARWGNNVDAIIHVSTKVGDGDPPTIAISAEAIRMKDPCHGCRHSLAPPVPSA